MLQVFRKKSIFTLTGARQVLATYLRQCLPPSSIKLKTIGVQPVNVNVESDQGIPREYQVTFFQVMYPKLPDYLATIFLRNQLIECRLLMQKRNKGSQRLIKSGFVLSVL